MEIDSNINFIYNPPLQEPPSSTYNVGTFQAGASNDSVSVIVDLEAAYYTVGIGYILNRHNYTWTASGVGSNGPYSGYVKITTTKVPGLKSGGYADVIFWYDLHRFPNAGTFSGTIQGHNLTGGFQ